MAEPDLVLRLLGALEVVVDGRPVELRSARQRAALILLALHAPATVGVATLEDALWGDAPPKSAHHALHVHVSALRRSLGAAGAAIETRPGGYGLAVAEGAIDARRFAQLVAEGRRGLPDDPRAAAGILRQALDLWRGPACADVRDEPWAAGDAGRLEDLRLSALEARIEADLALGRHLELAVELRPLTREHPYRERLWHALILSLYRSGQASEALAAARELRGVLDEIGVLPAPELHDLERRMLLHDPALGQEDRPARRASGLPAPSGPLLGREDEARQLKELLADPGVRLVTVRGPGGVGKTRLVVDVVRSVAGAYPGGVVFVALAGVHDPALVLPTVARQLGLTEKTTPLAAELARELHPQPSLLVLDNTEHLLEAAPDVADLLAAAERLTVLVTSRARLHLSGEQDFALEPLGVPPAGGAPPPAGALMWPAVALFADRARAVRRDLHLTAAAIETMGEICRRLDGLPLAIELAAARCRLFEPEELCRRLDRRLDLLGSGPRDLPRRQQTLRATIEWSEGLLPGEARILFARLAVFAGGFDLDAAEEVCCEGLTDPLTAMETLLDNSLIQPAEPAGRLAMLETIREHAVDRLELRVDGSAVRDRHATWALALARGAQADLRGRRRRAAISRMTTELDNLRAALRWLDDRRRPGDLGRLAAGLEAVWHTSGHPVEGQAWLERALADPALPRDVRARALASQARLAMERGELDQAVRLGNEAAGLARELEAGEPLAGALMALAGAAYYQGDYARMRQRLDDAAPLLEEVGDFWQLTFAGFARGSAALADGHHDEATALLTEAARGYERLGDDWGVAAAEMNLGAVQLAEQRPAEAALLLERAVGRFERLGDRSWIVVALACLSDAVAPADLDRAETLACRAARLAIATGQPIWLPGTLLTLADIALARDRLHLAASLLGARDAVGLDLGVVAAAHEEQQAETIRAALRERLGAPTLDVLVSEGAALEPEAAVALVQQDHASSVGARQRLPAM